MTKVKIITTTYKQILTFKKKSTISLEKKDNRQFIDFAVP